MSIESMAVVLHHSKSGGTDKLVLLGIANHDGDGGAWPSVATLARYANVEPRAVQAAIKRLVARGEVERERQAGGTRNMPDYTRPNLYHVKVVCPPECDRSAQHRINYRVSSTTPGVVSDTPPLSATTPKPSLNHPYNSDKSSFVSTSPAAAGSLCWACGNAHGRKARYCTGCSSRGMNSPIINCQHDECGNTGRRTFPGQQVFDCGAH